MDPAPITILCVDDHTIVRKGLTAVLEQQPDMRVVAHAADGPEAIEKHRQYRPDITLMDLQLPRLSGFEAIRGIREHDPDAKIIVLTMYRGAADVTRALNAGAAAYLLKDAPLPKLFETIRQVKAGVQSPRSAAGGGRAAAGEPVLTAREDDVMQLLAKGFTNKEIAAALGIGEGTVQTHVKSIFVKLDAHDRTEAVVTAVRHGIVHLD